MQSNIDPEPRKAPESYRLKVKGTPITVSGRYWKTDRIYLNDVCLAVVVEPIGKGAFKGQEAKEELYGMLRGIAGRALQHDLMRPLAAFVENADDPKTVAAWGAEQDWHRGAFTLYVKDPRESGKSAPTHEELLDQRIELLSSTRYQERRAPDVLADACKFDAPSPELKKLCESIQTVMVGLEKETDMEKRLRAVDGCLEDWRRDIVREPGVGG
jgi:hypothetical protein